MLVKSPLHRWDLSIAEAIALQKRLAAEVVRLDRFAEIATIAGVDVSYDKPSGVARAAVVIVDATTLAPLAEATAAVPVAFPYVPGLLSFREAPAAIAALAEVEMVPDILMCDGQGIAHPRRFGLASHLGVFLDLPSIGVAKSRLTGHHEEPGLQRGAWTPLLDRGEVIGAALRTRTGKRPLYVSIGHRVCLPTALAMVMRCTRGLRLPETTRLADRLSKQWKVDQGRR